MNLLTRNFGSPDWLTLALIFVIAVIILYYVIRWINASRNYSDSADDYALGCLSLLNWGCWLPMSILLLLLALLL